MNVRKIRKQIQGIHAVDGAGVHLTRVIGHGDVKEFDPFLMLDSFDSTNPSDYIAGFPMHPHRGIETVTYLIHGDMEHQDSLGNKGSILDGQSQWMNAGSGIMHQEMPVASDSMLGFQLWVNLPRKDKMSQPTYTDIKGDMIKVIKQDHATVRVIAGAYEGVEALKPKYVDVQLFDVSLDANASIELPTREKDTAFIFILKGEFQEDEKVIAEKTAILYGEGNKIKVTAGQNGARFVLFAGEPLKEPVAWGGPIVMNTEAELNEAFNELSRGTFIKHKI